MQLCNILNCSLDDLVDDGACGNGKMVEQKININTYLKEVLDFITKTLNMFWSMRLVEKIKCILEMGLIIFIIFLVWRVIGEVIYSIFDGIIYMLPNFLMRLIYNISSIIYNIFGLILGFIIFIHIFKVRYLDYFVTIEDSSVVDKVIEEPILDSDNEEKKIQFTGNKKNKIIIRDPKHSVYSFFGVLARIIDWFIKFILLFVAFFGGVSFIVLIFGLTFSIWKIYRGIIFLGIAIMILGCVVVNFIVLRVIYNFLLNQKNNIGWIFRIFIFGFVLIGVGIGISFGIYLTFDKEDYDNDMEYVKRSFVLDKDEDIVIDFLDDYRTELIIDDSVSEVTIDIMYNKMGNIDLDYYDYSIYDDDYRNYKIYYVNYYDGINNFIDGVIYLCDRLEDKKRIDNYQYEEISEIQITLSNRDLEWLRSNEMMAYNG